MHHKGGTFLSALAAAGGALGFVCAFVALGDADPAQAAPRIVSTDTTSASASVGPDIVLADIPSTLRYSSVDTITAFSIWTTFCNIGDERIGWEALTNDHPVWFYNLYRLKDGRFEQIGMSWVLHGFFVGSENFCGPCTDYTNGSELGVGCSDTMSAHLNGVQSNMSPRSTVNAFSGSFPYPWSGPPVSSAIERRMQVRNEDLDPALNAGAMYFVEAQTITPDDAASNVFNNASYRRVRVHCRTCIGGGFNGQLCDGAGDCPGGTCPPEGTCSTPGIYYLNLEPEWPTQVGQPAIQAWKDNDPNVFESEIQVPGEGRYILAAKATALGDGYWHYEYALQNFNSHRSAGSISLCLGLWNTVRNLGFHDIDYHSGEVYDSTDWSGEITEGGIQWSTQSYTANPNANALRFGTLYNFRLDSSAPPEGPVVVQLGLFRPGNAQEVWAGTIGPMECANDYDFDRDGQSGCFDYCPHTPPGVCTCQGMGVCCLGCLGPCFEEERSTCVALNGTPDECGDPTCKSGCPLLDMDNDGDRDLADFAGLQRCFTRNPDLGCIHRLDVNDDGVVNLLDFGLLQKLALLR